MEAAYALMDIVAEPPQSERRVFGFARSLRSNKVARHVRVLPAEDHSILITVLQTPPIPTEALLVVEQKPAKKEGNPVSPQIQQRLSGFIGQAEAVELAQKLYARTVELGSANYLNVAEPYMDHKFSERQYDYTPILTIPPPGGGSSGRQNWGIQLPLDIRAREFYFPLCWATPQLVR
ncbi:MAG: hypothetical protein Fur0032_19140 [Terrimicrobiaceae bacterium]